MQSAHTTEAQSVLSVEGLRLSRGSLRGKPFSFNTNRGERWALLGNNASGKTTLLHTLAGVLQDSNSHAENSQAENLHTTNAEIHGQYVPSDGHIFLSGMALHSFSPAALSRRRSLLLQSSHDTFDWRVHDWLALHSPNGFQPSNAATLEASAQALDVHHLLGRAITELSGGERQRMGLLALATAQTPLWLLDEPVSAQDPRHQWLCAQWLLAQTRLDTSVASSRALIFSAHDVNWAAQIATHVLAMIPDGSVRIGTAAEMLTTSNLQAIYGVPWLEASGHSGQRVFVQNAASTPTPTIANATMGAAL